MIFKSKQIIILIFLFIALIIFSCTDNNPKEKDNTDDYQYLNRNSFKGFYFITETSSSLVLNYYNFIDDTILTIFNNKNEKVIEVEHNSQNNSVFFITIKRLNKNLDIPEFEGIKLYHYDNTSKSIKLINNFSSSIQVYSFWVDINRFKFIRVFFDEVVASYVVKHSIIYNPFGKLIFEENEVFDIIKSGYPVIEKANFKLMSSDKKIQIKFGVDSIFIFNNKTQKVEATFNKKNILDIAWTDDDNYLILFLEDTESNNRNIVIYEKTNNQLTKKINLEGIKNFILQGKYLIFDYKENDSSIIEILHIERLLTIKKLSIGKNNFIKNAKLK
ncbi:MAG: hypothetical protein NZM09_02330 [Ignavibacterium sp.]|nr:hypothetical protein [Ignavibacterium sp.]MDW8374513.1 hypothetical protein [Ignavibacteriales bacterium]